MNMLPSSRKADDNAPAADVGAMRGSLPALGLLLIDNISAFVWAERAKVCNSRRQDKDLSLYKRLVVRISG